MIHISSKMKNKVSVVRCFSYDQREVDFAVKKALSLIDFSFGGVKRVLIKPNIAWPAKPELSITTHPSVIESICKILKHKNIEILIGESSIFDTRQGFQVSEIKSVADRYNAQTVIFGTTPLLVRNNITLPRILQEIDLIINVPKLKTHTLTKYTGAVKNVFGFIPGGRKAMFHKRYPKVEDLAGFFVELYTLVNPGLTIMDGIIGMEGDGPSAGVPKKSALVLASRDGIALDRVACKIIGIKNVWTNRIALMRGLGKKFEIVGNSHLSVPFRKPSSIIGSAVGLLPKSIRESLGTQRIIIDKHKCTECGLCKKHCPVSAIDERHNINYSKCIHCYCCQEICPNHAVTIKLNRLLLAIRQMRKFLSLMERLKRKILPS